MERPPGDLRESHDGSGIVDPHGLAVAPEERAQVGHRATVGTESMGATGNIRPSDDRARTVYGQGLTEVISTERAQVGHRATARTEGVPIDSAHGIRKTDNRS